MARVLLVSPYHGGSHAAWANGLRDHSAHDIELLSLPDRFWKWRMHGGAVTLARRFLRGHASDGARRPDLIVATDMLDLSTFLALTRTVTADTPALLYMHENQLTYPLPADPEQGPMRRQKGERDHHYAFINYASMLAADRVAFNSRYHLDAWFAELPRFLRHFPEHNEVGGVEALRARSVVLPVGIDGPERLGAGAVAEDGCDTAGAGKGKQRRTTPATPVDPAPDRTDPEAGTRDADDDEPLLLWNQRWEYDKNPDQLVRALRRVAERGVRFRLALCGQSFSDAPPALGRARELFADRLVQFGFAEPDTYRELLRRALVTVSTAEHEFFGIAVLEAMAHGAFAVLPDRLSYPELLAGDAVAEDTRRRCLYRSEEELVDALTWALSNPQRARRLGEELAANARRYRWSAVIGRYDAELSDLAAGRSAPSTGEKGGPNNLSFI